VIQLRYFASLRETLGTGAEQIELPGNINDLSGLTDWLRTRGEPWQEALADNRIHVAINQEIVNHDSPVADGDEVAWFPPVTGG
jgi:molybdopterin synthase sulfur carrier subunit